MVVVETTELDHMEQRPVFINPTKAMECLLLALLMNMPHLLPLEVLEDLLFTVVIVLWAEVWETMVARELLNRPRHPRDLEAVAHLVVLMIHSAVAAPSQVKANSTTTPPTKATNPSPVTT